MMYLEEKEYPKSEGLYLVFASSFAVLLVLTNIIGIKLFAAPLYSITSKLLFFIPQDANGFAPLHVVGNPELVKCLIENGAAIDIKSKMKL